MASSQNFFVWFRGVLICQRGLIPRKKKSCGVSDPMELSLAGYQTLQNNGRVASCVHFTADTCSARSDTPAEQHPAGSDTPLNKVLRGIRPPGIKSCGVSNPAEHHLDTNISANSKQNSKIF
jgi:hypothetical protein